MKRLFTLIAAVLVVATGWTQSPEKMSYQAVVRNIDGVLVQNSNVAIKISLLQGTTSGTIVYSETHIATTNINGLATLEIGGGSVVSGSFANIDWSAGPYFLKTETDPTGGTSYTIAGTSQLLSVPYALHAKTAETADYNDLINLPAGNTKGEMQYWNGTSWAIVPVGQPGQFLQFSTSNIPAWSGSSFPELTTTPISTITKYSATSGGNIINDGGLSITARGVCWSTLILPTIADTKTTEAGTIGTFTSSLSGLTGSTIYYVRAYATNSLGTGYGLELSFTTEPVSIGDSYQGGIVAYILQSGDPGYNENILHGLIVSMSDLGPGISWSNGSNITTGATGTAIGTGKANTTIIITSQGNEGSYAAKVCRDYTGGGYMDWYLPSIDELNKIYLNKTLIGGLVNMTYWSSSEYDQTYAWAQYFQTGSQGYYNPKNITAGYNVRAIRSF